jgi:hypothetical protein
MASPLKALRVSLKHLRRYSHKFWRGANTRYFFLPLALTVFLGGCQNLYVVSQNGKLFKVDQLDPNATGGARAIFERGIDTTVPIPNGMCAGCSSFLFVLGGQGSHVYRVDPGNGAFLPPSPLPGLVTDPTIEEGMASGSRGNLLYYCRDVGTSGGCTLFQYSISANQQSTVLDLGSVFRPTDQSGNSLCPINPSNPNARPFRLAGLTLNPADRMLYGTGRDCHNDAWLFKVAVDGSNFVKIGKTFWNTMPPTPCSFAETNNPNPCQPISIAGLAFVGGTLYGMDNVRQIDLPNNTAPHLLAIDPGSGQVVAAFLTIPRDPTLSPLDLNLGVITDLSPVAPWYTLPLCWRNLTLIVILGGLIAAMLVWALFLRKKGS